VPDDANVLTMNGSYVVDGINQTENNFLLINGSLIVKPGITLEAFNRSFCGGAVNGVIYFPENLSAAAASFKVNGSIHIYPADSLTYDQHLVINNSFLQSLPEDASITAFKGVTIEDSNLDVLKSLTVFGDTVLPESMKNAFYKVAKSYGNIIEIPEGYTLYDEQLEIRPANQFSFRGKSIYTTKSVYLFEGIEQLDFKLITEGTVIAPDTIAMALSDRIEARGMFYTYQGGINVVTGVQTYTNIPGNYLVMPHAELIIPEDADLTAIEYIYLQGDIVVDKEEQIATLNEKLVLNKGWISCKSEEEEDDEDLDEYDVVLGNAAAYKL